MSGGVLKPTRAGFQAELLVQCFLNAFAFTTQVRIQDDVGVDFDCVLAEPRENMLCAGPFFTVQAKKGADRLVYKKPHEVDWIVDHAAPLFLAVEREELRVEIYSLWRRIPASLHYGKKPITFEVGAPTGGAPWVEASDNSAELRVYLGEPVVSAKLPEVLLDRAKADEIRKRLRYWIDADLSNIVCSGAGMHWTVNPSDGQAEFFYNGKNFEKCELNLWRSAVAMRLTDALARRHGLPCLDPGRLEGVDALLRAWADSLGPEVKEELLRAGLEL